MAREKLYHLKSEHTESFSTPKTPSKKQAFRHHSISIPSFQLNRNVQPLDVPELTSSDINEHTSNSTTPFYTPHRFSKQKNCQILYFNGSLNFLNLQINSIEEKFIFHKKIGEGDFSEVFCVQRIFDSSVMTPPTDPSSFTKKYCKRKNSEEPLKVEPLKINAKICKKNDFSFLDDNPFICSKSVPRKNKTRYNRGNYNRKIKGVKYMDSSFIDSSVVLGVNNGESFSNENLKNNLNFSCIKKYLRKYSGETDRLAKLMEVKILYELLYCENIISIISAYEVDSTLFIETEYCNLGSLRDFINYVYCDKKSNFVAEIVHKIMIEVGSALKFMHGLSIVHGDLKPENIFLKGNLNSFLEQEITDLNENGIFDFQEEKEIFFSKMNTEFFSDKYIFKVGDFNISKYEDSSVEEDGDKKYMAPETLDGIGVCSSDIYSFGLIYLEILRGIVLPDGGITWSRLRNNNFYGLKLAGLSGWERRMVVQMIDKEYKLRPSAEEIVKIFDEHKNVNDV
ncbi:mitosis inhibitor protein kinase swe1 [Hamiltosporidium tvaerminnensis]|nr:mitosis inhibitor protein kinase swe1 [Hamiltosporidium tvaerminnensis]